jgi:hypothetical protein
VRRENTIFLENQSDTTLAHRLLLALKRDAEMIEWNRHALGLMPSFQ